MEASETRVGVANVARGGGRLLRRQGGGGGDPRSAGTRGAVEASVARVGVANAADGGGGLGGAGNGRALRPGGGTRGLRDGALGSDCGPASERRLIQAGAALETPHVLSGRLRVIHCVSDTQWHGGLALSDQREATLERQGLDDGRRLDDGGGTRLVPLVRGRNVQRMPGSNVSMVWKWMVNFLESYPG